MIHETIGKGSGLEVHHLIERRLAARLGIKESDIPSIVLTKDEHLEFTQRCRKNIGYAGSNTSVTTSDATRTIIFEYAIDIYKDYPEILNVIKEMNK